MHHRYETNSNHSSISSAGFHGAFLGTAREKREKLLRKAQLNQQRYSGPSSSPPPPSSAQSMNEAYPFEYRYYRNQPNGRTQSVDEISSSSTATNASGLHESLMPRTASQASLNRHRASPCPSDLSFSYSNPKYFVRSHVLRPATTKAPLHYENVLVKLFIACYSVHFSMDFRS